MNDISPVLDILDTLLSKDGCPWDQKQTLDTIKGDLLEEACEVIDAIENKSKEEVTEELGDLLFVLLFLFRLAEKEHFTSFQDIIEGISAKLIRRHPHIFQEKKQLTDDELLAQWDEIKRTEKPKARHPLERIPNSLPALSKALETLKTIHKHSWKKPEPEISDPEMALGKELFSLVEKAEKEGHNPEFALKKYLAACCTALESTF